MLLRARRLIYGSPIELPFLHDHDATREIPARISENPLKAEFAELPFHALR